MITLLAAWLVTTTVIDGEKLERTDFNPKCSEALNYSYTAAKKLISAGAMSSFMGKCMVEIESFEVKETTEQRVRRYTK